jgi:hypothetical protein
MAPTKTAAWNRTVAEGGKVVLPRWRVPPVRLSDNNPNGPSAGRIVSRRWAGKESNDAFVFCGD